MDVGIALPSSELGYICHTSISFLYMYVCIVERRNDVYNDVAGRLWIAYSLRK